MKYVIAAAALAASIGVAEAAPTRINLCTGAAGQPYAEAGQMIARMAKGSPNLDLHVIADTGGTWSNIEMSVLNNPTAEDYANGKACHAFIGQPDGLAYLSRTNRGAVGVVRQIASLHREYAHILCSRDSKVTKLQQLRDNPSKYSIALGSRGSGGWLLWQNFVDTDKKLGEVATKSESGNIALSAVATDSTTCTIVPAGLGGVVMLQANEMFADKLSLTAATAGSFTKAKGFDGKDLYVEAQIPGGTYKRIQSGWFSSAVDTVAWDAGLYVNTDRIPDEKVLSELIMTTMRARPGIVAQFSK